MALYESTFIVRQDVSTQDVDKISDAFSKIVTDHKGKVVKKEYWGLRSLAYKVAKNKKGHYVLLCIDAQADAVNELQRQQKLNEDVIRNLTVRVDEISKEPSPLSGRKVAPRKHNKEYNKEYNKDYNKEGK